ncbi:aldehyde dehydrogenase (NAD) family protein [Aeromicrobium marinum DSM 15272]|uniref:L-glutamate gamma-semialdehyde dehydrogenase n=1 Tax=Aeromicrobium marinum DSM 15272 TaxID=585531 RepID=E2SAB5_9ACTN|nr:bifunctional proline dehydrogenase/L-glutamate gamma-semialdehyde dehydrogenase [Aeromicrobium marinum]EFQ84189.1 aldehyde dehydrogenase (NAD) family protein [Aeromicrobium marinum DSM 15272]
MTDAPAPPDSATLPDRAVELVREWTGSRVARKRADPAARRLADLLADPDGLSFTIGFVDGVIRPEDPRVAAANLRRLARSVPGFLPRSQRVLLRLGALFSRLFPAFVVGRATAVLRRLVGHLVVDVRDRPLTRTIAKLRSRGDRLNLNLLGEAVLGEAEAARRREAVTGLMQRDDVDYVSVKVSAVASQLSLWSFEQTVDRVVDQLVPLYETAASGAVPTFVNLDMEEYRDLHLTLAVFTRALDRFPDLEAGIVLQAYLPDSLQVLGRLQTWAYERHLRGGKPVKVRIVKGANLAMERVDAEIHGWPLATWGSKVETDATYKRLLDLAIRPDRVQAMRVGVAGQNLFDLAWAWLLAGDRGVRDAVDVEMLLGMDAGPAAAARRDIGALLLYTPVVHPDEFDTAISYLVRRLEENASPDNFMSSAFRIAREPDAFALEESRFRASVAAIGGLDATPRRVQDRRDEGRRSDAGAFSNTPDTDPSVAGNREWAGRALARASYTQVGTVTVADSAVHGPAGLETVIRSARAAAADWQARTPEVRAWLLHQAGHALAARRSDLVTVMAAEAGKTVAEADVEVSEAIDFAHYYAESLRRLEVVDGARFVPVGLTVVAPPWNFPVAIPAGSVLAALAAGSGVIIKPAPQVPRCVAVVVEALWQAGIPRDLLRYVALPEGPLSKALISHSDVDRVVLTGSWETAALFRSWRADLPLLAETSGKNALVVTPSADLDLAVADLARSAFGHAGQKCSAASLGILVGSVGTSERFRRQLVDTVTSMVVGHPEDPTSVMGPLIEPPGDKLTDGLTRLGDGESWLIEPRRLDDTGRLWSPGVRVGVRPGSEFHRTEYFGPVLGLMHAPDLDTAITWQNATDFGLTAGIHALDVDEVRTWVDRVEAGNLYVNRGITGAIVQRQPFGGWKRSSVGATAKAGGPNYLTRLGGWEPRPLRAARGRTEISAEVTHLLSAMSPMVTSQEMQWLSAAAESDQVAWEREFGVAKDVSGLACEHNVFRYLPVPVTVRAEWGRSGGTSTEHGLRDLLRVLLAARRAGAPVTVSSDLPLPRGLDVPSRIESGAAWTARLSEDRPQRVRLVGADHRVAARAVDGDPDVAFYTDPVTQSGRVEALPFLREQSVTITNHRFGHPVDVYDDLFDRA